MGRQPCCDKVGLKRGPWTIDEDQKLMNFILNNGIQCWRLVPKLAGLKRCGKSCRLRWMNYLRPDLKRGALSEEEEDLIIQLHSRLGNRWSKIAAHFPGRTDNEIKNHWNTKIKKKLKLLGLDPQTHKPNQESDAKGKGDLDPKPMKEETLIVSNIDESNLVNNDKTQSEDQDAGSSLNQCTDQSDSFSSRNGDFFPPEDFQEQWVNNMDSLLAWDGFSNLEDIISL